MKNSPSLLFRVPGAALVAACIAAALVSSAHAQTQPQARWDTGRNVYEAGASVRPTGPVAGDFVGAGARVVIDQSVAGDVLAAGASVDVRAAVGDDLRAVAGDAALDARVGGELFMAGGNVSVGRNSAVARDAQVFGGAVTLDGVFEGRLAARARKLVFNGEVRGDADLSGEEVVLGPQARIAGNLAYAAQKFDRAEGAVVSGAITRSPLEAGPGRGAPAAGDMRHGGAWGPAANGSAWGGRLLGFLGLLVCAALYLLVAPAFAERAAQRIGATPWLALGIGLATLAGVPLVAMLLFVTVLGIPLAMAAMMLYPVLMLFGFLGGAFFVARFLPDALRRPAPATFAAHLGYAALALLALGLASLVPFAGGILIGLLAIAGIGAFVLQLDAVRRGAGSGDGQAIATGEPLRG